MTALSIPDALLRRLSETPDAPYVRVGDQTDWLTFRDVDERSSSLARGLAASGLSHGDRVLTILPNSIEVIDLLFAVAKVGAVQVAVNIYAKGEPLRHQIEDSDPSMIVTDAEGFEAVRGFLSGRSKMTVVTLQAINVDDLDVDVHRFQDLARRGSHAEIVLADSQPSDIAAISYTSGTTGAAKGCLMSHGYYTSIGHAYMSRNAFQPGDRVLAAMPCYHLGAVSLLMGCAHRRDVRSPRASILGDELHGDS